LWEDSTSCHSLCTQADSHFQLVAHKLFLLERTSKEQLRIPWKQRDRAKWMDLKIQGSPVSHQGAKECLLCSKNWCCKCKWPRMDK
jgi:hypothetical protein